MGIRNPELLHENRLLGLERDLVQQQFGSPEVELGGANGLVVVQQHLQVLGFEVRGDL